jgi:HAE1 family hydrophobic/amphiphilic exporter-1
MTEMANMGCVILVGVVVNNAIVLVDVINRAREAGGDRHAAILEAGESRYRPILMTTFTTVFGLVPMAVSTASMMGQPYAPLGRTMMGGLMVSTALTLVVVPVFYTLLDDLRTVLRRIAAGAFGGAAEAPEAVPAAAGDDD